MKKIWNKIPPFLRNKYAITGIVFGIWMLFFDENDFISQIQLQRELHQLEEDKAFYKEEITKTQADLDELLTNDNNLEKFAREKYLMKKENEVIYVLVEEDKEN